MEIYTYFSGMMEGEATTFTIVPEEYKLSVSQWHLTKAKSKPRRL